MRTTLAALWVLGLLIGCERRNDQETGAELDRSGTDTMVPSAAVGDTTADVALDSPVQ